MGKGKQKRKKKKQRKKVAGNSCLGEKVFPSNIDKTVWSNKKEILLTLALRYPKEEKKYSCLQKIKKKSKLKIKFSKENFSEVTWNE